jgi:3-methyl-2-oxobutanoate hydroxymethyltransferase
MDAHPIPLSAHTACDIGNAARIGPRCDALAKPMTVATLAHLKTAGERIACLTCYDASFTQLLESAGVEVLLVGDSLGNVLQGHDSTLPVTVADMAYHAACVARARRRALLVVDLPFLSYSSPKRALKAAAQLIQRGGAQMVKLEGGAEQVETVRRLTDQGVAVCAHLGLLPQSVHRFGGYRVQGRTTEAAEAIQRAARDLETAGAGLLVLECVPSALARDVSHALRIPVIGIGAGNGCDGQVLVLYDLLGITPTGTKPPRFVKNFLAGHDSVQAAIRAYVEAVKAGHFPAAEHSFD